MQVVSNKLELGITAQSPQGSQRALVRKDTANSPQRRWNSSTNRSSHGRRESLAGNSLLSLKAYYRKLRTFKGTVKALINLRRVPTVLARHGSIASAAAAAVETSEKTNAETNKEEQRAGSVTKVSEAVRKLSKDDQVLQTVQTQVKELVEKGHVVTELDPSTKDDVAYRIQGNLEHYTEENLRKRLELQEHPHLVALTQRLWLAAVHDQEDHLTYGEYEAYMLRLHRLILPEFDIAQSKELIRDDWNRDTEGGEFLDYRYFHFSMFELVDLWTDTVDAEDYISLLYVIMHCLTFEWNDRHLLRDLEDINPVDILEESKMVTIEEIEKDLAREVNSDVAQVYRDRIALEEDVPGGATTEEPIDALPTKMSIHEGIIEHTEEQNTSATHTERRKSKKDATPRKPSGTMDKGMTRTRSTPSNPSKERKPSKEFGPVYPAPVQVSSPSNGNDSPTNGHEGMNQSDSSTNGTASTLIANSTFRSAGQKDYLSSKLNIQVKQQVQRSRGSASQASPRIIYPSGSMNQYGIGRDDSASPFSITSLGSSGNFINMVSKASFTRKSSVMSGTGGLRSSFVHGNQLSADGDAVHGYGLQGTNRYVATPSSPRQIQGHEGTIATHVDESFSPSPRSQPISFRSPRPLHVSLKEAEVRPGSLSVSGEHRSPPIVYGGQSNFSPRAKSARSDAQRAQSQEAPFRELTSRGDGDVGGNMPPLSAIGLDLSSLAGSGSIDNRAISRPSTTSTYRTVGVDSGRSLGDFLHAKGYHESSVRLSRPLPRASRFQQHQMLVDDLGMNPLGIQAATISANPHSPRARALVTTPHTVAVSTNRHAFAVGAPHFSLDTKPITKHSSPRTSVAKITRWPSSSTRVPMNQERFRGDLGLAGSSARLSSHSPPTSLRRAASP